MAALVLVFLLIADTDEFSCAYFLAIFGKTSIYAFPHGVKGIVCFSNSEL